MGRARKGFKFVGISNAFALLLRASSKVIIVMIIMIFIIIIIIILVIIISMIRSHNIKTNIIIIVHVIHYLKGNKHRRKRFSRLEGVEPGVGKARQTKGRQGKPREGRYAQSPYDYPYSDCLTQTFREIPYGHASSTPQY